MTFTPVKLLQIYLNLAENQHKLGRLAVKDRQIYFEYDPDFLATRLDISPFVLPLRPGVRAGDRSLFEGLHGVFNDSLPDGWGRLLLDRQLRKFDIDPGALTPLDRLAHVGQRGMGALLYEPDYSTASPETTLNLDNLAEESRQILEGEPVDLLEELLALNGSAGGARPKVMVGVNKDLTAITHGVDALPPGYSHWLVKFPASSDRKDSCAIEYAYALMAKAAGIVMMPTHLFPAKKGTGYFAVKRFDRDGNQRRHMHTASGLLNADFRIPALDYKDVLLATRLLTKDQREVEKLYRVAAFNVLAHNRDDHSKNFSFLMDGSGRWCVSPAYDLTFSSGPGGEHSTMVMGEGKIPGDEQLLKLAASVPIQAGKAKAIIAEVKEAVFNWPGFARDAEVSQTSFRQITRVICSNVAPSAGRPSSRNSMISDGR